jgi:hypothetical protein
MQETIYCKRCNGRMTDPEPNYTPSGYAWSRRCLICGYVTDPTIEENRKLHPRKEKHGRPRGFGKVYRDVEAS